MEFLISNLPSQILRRTTLTVPTSTRLSGIIGSQGTVTDRNIFDSRVTPNSPYLAQVGEDTRFEVNTKLLRELSHCDGVELHFLNRLFTFT